MTTQWHNYDELTECTLIINMTMKLWHNGIMTQWLTGWAWHTLAISSHEAPYSIARTASLINSPATWIAIIVICGLFKFVYNCL